MKIHSLALVLALGLCALSSCGDDENTSAQPRANLVVQTEATLEDETIVAGGSLFFEVSGAGSIIPVEARIQMDGQHNGAPLKTTLPASFEVLNQGETVRLEVSWDNLSASLGGSAESDFAGSFTVELDDLGGGLKAVSAPILAMLSIRPGLQPSMSVPDSLEIFPNSTSRLPSEGILRPTEGETVALLQGMFTPDAGEPFSLDTELTVLPGESRKEAQIQWPPTLFGIRPGAFEGKIRLRNYHKASEERESDAYPLYLSLKSSEIDGFDPPGGSRGQSIKIIGRGFIPSDLANQQSMYFLFDGMFQTRSGTVVDFSGPKAIQLAPEAIEGGTDAVIVLRSQLTNQGGRLKLSGFTATPGDFQGTLTPVLVDRLDTFEGQPFEGTLTIEPTHQYVHVKFVPSFSASLNRFGLRNVEAEIRTRIFEVLQRDYKGLHMTFTDAPPENFVEYSTIEVAGPDPNGAGLFGLDNSAGKDTGNLRLNDILGGQNAESDDLGFYSFGGVFIDSFTTFSPTLSNSNIASSRFDDIFSPFMEELGGTPVKVSEWPEGPRAQNIEEAIRVMGNLIGSTLTHEIGHSLGLAFFQNDLFMESTTFHNTFDRPGAIMDGGAHRPFEERAEIDGAPQPFFTDQNREYLEMILPLP